MRFSDSRPLCRCGCGAPAYPDSGFARGWQFWARVQKSDGCWLWIGPLKGPGSYGRLRVNERIVRAHRIAWELASGALIPEGFHVLHTCDVRHCVRNDEEGVYEIQGLTYPRYGHLWLANHEANMADKRTKGRGNYPGAGEHQARGEKIGCAKLTEDDVRSIRQLLADGQSLRAIAAQFSVSKGPITGISRGKLWTHVV